MIRAFNVDIEICVDADMLYWPEPGEAVDDRNLGCNREYADLRGLSWRDVSEILKIEEDLLLKYDEWDGLPEDSDDWEDDGEEEDWSHRLSLIDIGVAAVVAALSAARCVPCTSCNGGALGGHHHECYPLVAFYARPQHVPLLVRSAELSGVGLEHSAGMLVVYSDDVRKMPLFARKLLALRKEFRQLRFRAGATRTAAQSSVDVTLSLPFDDFSPT